MKRRLGVPFIFDMRGFWADERVDGRIWNLSNPLFRLVYRYFKRREAEFLAEAAQVISLTEAGERILLDRRGGATGPPITVIPCCVDFAAFPPVSKAERAKARGELGIDPSATVAAYLGSWGSWYLTGEMLDFFRVQIERDPGARFLIVSREPADQIRHEAQSRGIPPERIIVRPASRAEVPQLLAAADYGLFFIMPVFSKKASSPTKLGEFLSLELPVVTNGGVGDVEQVIEETGAGAVVRTFDDEAYRRALDALDQLSPNMNEWRGAARRWFDLDRGVESYDAVYRGIANGDVGSAGPVG
jgi:glycosyltransferase involved in cell wall biosynthesis